MARTVLTVVSVDRASTGVLAETAGDVGNGNAFVNDTDTRTFVHVRNSGASSYTLTLQIPVTVDGQAVAAKVLTITAGQTQVIGPFPGSTYTQADANVWINANNAALMLAVFHLTSQ